MARVDDFLGSTSSNRGRRKTAKPPKAKEQSKKKEASADQGVSLPAIPEPDVGRSVVPEQDVTLPDVPEPSAALVLSAIPERHAIAIKEEGEKEEEEEEEPPLKRKRTVGVISQPPCPSDKGEGKKQATDSRKWVSTIRLDEAASNADFDVALHIAEKAVPLQPKNL